MARPRPRTGTAPFAVTEPRASSTAPPKLVATTVERTVRNSVHRRRLLHPSLGSKRTRIHLLERTDVSADSETRTRAPGAER